MKGARKVLSVHEPVDYVVEKRIGGVWTTVATYTSLKAATARASDLASTYGMTAQVVEVSK